MVLVVISGEFSGSQPMDRRYLDQIQSGLEIGRDAHGSGCAGVLACHPLEFVSGAEPEREKRTGKDYA